MRGHLKVCKRKRKFLFLYSHLRSVVICTMVMDINPHYYTINSFEFYLTESILNSVRNV
jgi:hypothetical protein